MYVHLYDSVADDWKPIELPIADDCKDPIAINQAIEKLFYEESEEPTWKVKNHGWCGNIMTIETRSDRGHLCLIIIDYDDQPNRKD